MNLTTDQSCDHAVLISSKHAGKSERSKNSHVRLFIISVHSLHSHTAVSQSN